MRTNPVKDRLSRGEISIGTMVMAFTVPGIGRIAAAAGADFVIFDMEHTGLSTETLGMLTAATAGTEVAPIVRVPAVNYQLLARPLEVGAMGIMVPCVETADQARWVVERIRYPPEGKRGTAFGIAHDDYTPGSIAETMRTSNENVLLIVQIESPTGVENANEIAAVDGVDILWVGHNGLTTSMGIPGEFEGPGYLEALDRVIDGCHTHGRVGGFMPDSIQHAFSLIDQGFRCFAYLSDIALYRTSLKAGVSAIRNGLASSA